MKDSFEQGGPLRLSRRTAAGPASIIASSFFLLAISDSERSPAFADLDHPVAASGEHYVDTTTPHSIRRIITSHFAGVYSLVLSSEEDVAILV